MLIIFVIISNNTIQCQVIYFITNGHILETDSVYIDCI